MFSTLNHFIFTDPSTLTAAPLYANCPLPATIEKCECATMPSQSSNLSLTTIATVSSTTMAETNIILTEVTTTADKTANPTKNAMTEVTFFTHATKCDKTEGAIMILDIIAGVAIIANGIVSILLFRR